MGPARVSPSGADQMISVTEVTGHPLMTAMKLVDSRDVISAVAAVGASLIAACGRLRFFGRDLVRFEYVLKLRGRGWLESGPGSVPDVYMVR